ncbi:MAG: winged helix DNA-binding protein, partial [Selenomonadaceae bacterium]|nr:winged helix DNA-binding protein [Selenomonadaceae bacterium]
HLDGIAPSMLASKVGVTRATVSVMLQRMEREELVHIRSDEQDGRGKIVILTEKGRKFMDDILPAHYLRVTELMGKLTEEEQGELGRLLKKLAGE